MANERKVFPILTKKEIVKLRESISYDVVHDVMRLLRNKTELSLVKTVSVLALAYIDKENGIVSKEELSTILKDADLNYSITLTLSSVLDELYEEIDALAKRFSSNQILSIIFSDLSWYLRNPGRRSCLSATPESFSSLARELLQIKAGEKVMDYCFGTGDFSINAYLYSEADYICGTEISTEAVNISKIRTAFISDSFNITQGDSIKSKEQADKVFVDPPLGVRDLSDSSWAPRDVTVAKFFENIPRAKRSDWMFVLSALEKQIKGGRTVILTYDSLLFRGVRGEMDIRRYLVDSGLLEAVIALPDGIRMDTNLQCDMLVFSQNNQKVKMVDARDCKVKEHNNSNMTPDNIKEILRRLNDSTEYSSIVSHADIAKRAYDLSPVEYLASSVIEVENGVSLSELSVSIGRGQVIPAVKIEQLATESETDFQYLMLKDVDNDTINLSLPHLKQIEDAFERSCINEGNLIISRSAPFKLAVVPNLHEKKVLATGNLYFLELDTSKVHPIYVLCYLKSREGMNQLMHLSRGSKIKILSLRDMQQIMIPLIPLEEQMAIVEKYLSIKRHLSVLNHQICELESQLAGLLERGE